MKWLNLSGQEFFLDQAIIKSNELAQKVQESYSPDLVIGIATGGILPGREIAKALGVEYAQLTIRREIDLKKIYGILPNFLKPFATLYHGYLFMITNPILIDKGNFECKGKKILIVDDAVHTGKTLKIAKDYIQERGSEQVRTATINHVSRVLPNYSLLKARIKYPWSKNSLDYSLFQSYIKLASS